MPQGYLLVLDGQGDEYAMIVDEEVWNWLRSDKPASVPEDASMWDELQLAPEKVRKAIEEAAGAQRDRSLALLEVTSGSYENDRMLHLQEASCLFHDMGNPRETERAAKRYAKQHGIQIVERYEGCIY
jgi:hypothetical protein